MGAFVQFPDRVTYELLCDEVSDRVQIVGFHGVEHLSQPYELRVDVEAVDEGTDLHAFVGTSISVELRRTDEYSRTFSGIVDRVRITDGGTTRQTGVLRIVPALALLALRTNSRIFQGKSALEIIEAVLHEGLSTRGRAFDASALHRERYLTRDYCVQYRETDLSFVHRLMEEEGIGYCFDAVEGSIERVVLFDESDQLARIRTMDEGPVRYDNIARTVVEAEPLLSFEAESMLRSRGVVLRDVDWTRGSPILHAEAAEDPSDEVYEHGLGLGTTVHEANGLLVNLVNLAVQALVPDGLPVGADNQVRDIAGFALGSFTENNVEHISRIRRELLGRDGAVGDGHGLVMAFAPGQLFELVGHPTLGVDGEYLLTRVVHSSQPADSDSVVNGEGERSRNYLNKFTCQPRSVPWRPTRQTPKPSIASIQTARVVGPLAAEIHTDSYGRVKVRFPWDRTQPNAMGDDTCWLRVAQMWAGANHPGTMFLPRVGMEVLVSFVDGDPDRPLVTGTVYNGENATPHILPIHATKSTIKTRTVPGGMGYNELTFDDALGREEVFIRAERDLRFHAQHDHETIVGNNGTLVVYGSKTELVGESSTTNVAGHHALVTEADERRSVGGDSHVVISGTRSMHVGRSSRTIIEKGSRFVSVEEGEHVLSSKERMIFAQGDENFIVLHTDDAPRGIGLESPEAVEIRAGNAVMKMHADGDHAISISSPTRIVLEVGASRLEITPEKITANKKIMPA